MWLCSQIGAREHYAVPRVLYRDKRLDTLYTDFWAGAFIRQMARTTRAKAFRSLAARFHSELSGAPVVSWNARSLGWEAGLRRQAGGNIYDGFIKTGSAFSLCVLEDLKRRNDLKPGSIFFSYDTGALEAMEW